MSNPQTTILPLEDILHRLDCFINQDDIGTIFPENFFISIRYYLSPSQSAGQSDRGIELCKNLSKGDEL